jgi:rhodanese-related sulfurtransferase
MTVKRISPEEARDLMDKEGYAYLDVRSVPEFAAGHPTGAYNIPLLHLGPAGMTPNPDFLAVVEKSFPRDAPLVVGCKAGGRSAKAGAVLAQAGFTSVVDQRCGYEGSPLPTGGVEPGWRPRGLPTSTDSAPDRTYDALKARG